MRMLIMFKKGHYNPLTATQCLEALIVTVKLDNSAFHLTTP